MVSAMIMWVKRSVDTVADRSGLRHVRPSVRPHSQPQARRPAFQMALIVRCSSTGAASGRFDPPQHRISVFIKSSTPHDARPFRRRFSPAFVSEIYHRTERQFSSIVEAVHVKFRAKLRLNLPFDYFVKCFTCFLFVSDLLCVVVPFNYATRLHIVNLFVVSNMFRSYVMILFII